MQKNVLTDEKVEELVELGKQIQMDLSCDANGYGLPCKTDRFEAIRNMIRYLEIHHMKIIDTKKPVIAKNEWLGL